MVHLFTAFLVLGLLVCLAPTSAAARLSDEFSPYLQRQASQPVDWYPWDAEAITRARRENKPIFLSVGYFACYWCQVMEREVFADPDIAAVMNAGFVNVKVDAELRPDLDRIYMTATQLLCGRAGWPNSVFLTPALQPFFAGTYFSAADDFERAGFPTVLRQVRDSWDLRRAEALKVAAQATAAVRALEAGQQTRSMAPDTVLVNRALAAIGGRYDYRHGGFGGPPKFPPCIRLEFLLASEARWSEDRVAAMVRHTLQAMARGGIRDQLGGGFHRYAVDLQWRAPRFEKMLYTQAQLARLYTRAYQVSGEPEWRAVAEGIFAEVKRELTSQDGAFYTALNAGADPVEGRFYRWTREQLEAALGDQLDPFLQLYALHSMAEGEGGVLYMQCSLPEAAAKLEMAPQALEDRLAGWRATLLQVRRQRQPPVLDDKVITAWNGMMIGACAFAYEVLAVAEYRRMATAAADFALDRLRLEDGSLARAWRGGAVDGKGYLEDYALLARGLLDLHRATGELRWLQAAEQIADQMSARFWDAAEGGFFFAEPADGLWVRSKNGQDSALPAANAVAVDCLLELAARTGKAAYLKPARQTLRFFGGMMHAQPAAFTSMIAVAERYLWQFEETEK